MGVIEVIEPGLLTTLQDMGRYGYLHHGVPASGAMDTVALRMANILTGNPEDEACLEITLAGPRLHFHSPALVAISGADLSPSLNDAPAPMWESVPGSAGRRSILRGTQVRDPSLRGGGRGFRRPYGHGGASPPL